MLIRLPRMRVWAAGALGALALCLTLAATAVAAPCPPIADKPGSVPHVNYAGVQKLSFCYGPISIQPGQNYIRLNGTNLKPSVPGYITRFDPEFVYADGSVPPVDVLHLHHAVWLHNGNPEFAAGEEKTISQLPQGFGWRSNPGDTWILNDMLHDLVAAPAEVYIVWRMDFVPDTSPAAAAMKTVTTRWMDVAGLNIYPVFDALRSMGGDTYTFPDQTTGDARKDIGGSQTWTAPGPRTLIGTAGHLHPGGLSTELRATRGSQTNSLFTSRANYYEPAGAVSWDVSMGATPDNWRVQLQAGDKLSVHTTYDATRGDWYEVMGIMPVAVYNGTDVGGVDAMSPSIPKTSVLTHGHLAENDNHGGEPTAAPDPRGLPSVPAPNSRIDITGYSYRGDPNAGWTVPSVLPGQQLTFINNDANPSQNAFHTITNCAPPCNGRTGIAYPVADGSVSFDSGQLGFNYKGWGAPAVDRDSWKTPTDLTPGTYSYFCRVHPFMRGNFRVQERSPCSGQDANRVGTAGNDVIRGTDGPDVIVGLGGNDKIIGLQGNDFICGGPGNDRLIGGPGKDKLLGAEGRDRLRGGSGKDNLLGGPGRDRLIGGLGKDRLAGGAGKDRERP